MEDARETVNGVDCVVIRKLDGGRTLWLDPTREYALIRYEHFRPVNGERRWQSDYHDLRELAPGLYFPWRVDFSTEKVHRDSGLARGTIQSSLRIKSMSLGPLDESLFALEPRPGETVVDDR